MARGEALQARQADLPTGKIKLAQGLGDPNIHWKGRGESIGEKEDAISDFPADTGQLH